MLTNKVARERIAGILRKEHFTDPLHGRIFGAMARLEARGDPVSAITVNGELGADAALNGVGGIGYLAKLVVASEDPESAEYSARRVADLHRRRTISARAEGVAAAARSPSIDGADGELEGALAEFTRAVQERPASGALPVRSWSELGTAAPLDRLVRRLLGTTSLAVIYGEPGCGKSFLAVDVGLHIAFGWEWFGRSVTQGAVLYVAGEGVAGLSNRLAGFKLQHNPEGDAPFYVVPVAINLGPDGADAERVIAAAKTIAASCGMPVLLIVVDTLARSMGAGDENSTQDMGRFVGACDRIREGAGACVLVVHHKGKSSTAGARGSTALLGAADTVIEVEKREAGRVAKVVKQKDGADGVEIGFDLEVVDLGEDDEGEPITTCVVRGQAEVAKAAPKLTKAEKRAMEVLHNTLIDFGESRVFLGNSVAFPNATVVKIERFRNALKSCGVTDRDNSNNERSQWRRMTLSLANKGVFAMRDDYCWACDRP